MIVFFVDIDLSLFIYLFIYFLISHFVLLIITHEIFVGYSKAPKQPQSSARPICQFHTMTSTGREPVTIRITAYRSSPRYALCHGRRH